MLTTLKPVNYALFISIIQYNIVVWSSTFDIILAPMFTLQNSSIKNLTTWGFHEQHDVHLILYCYKHVGLFTKNNNKIYAKNL